MKLPRAFQISPHTAAIYQALLVTVLWSSSWILIKLGLKDIPALSFAGLRYMLAFLCLLPLALRKEAFAPLRALNAKDWGGLVLLGVLFYAVTQGAQFLGLVYLPAATTSLALSFSAPLVAILGIFLLAERPGWLQWAGIALFLLGVVVYFYPVALPAGQVTGLIIMGVGLAANAFSSILGRKVNLQGKLSPLMVTVISMGIGAILLLAGGLWVQGMPSLKPLHWFYIVWLALVNTALAFPLWNHTLRTLTAVESTLINNTMLAQIAVLAWVFLGETLNARQIIGLALACAGVLLVQMRRQKPDANPPQSQPASESVLTSE